MTQAQIVKAAVFGVVFWFTAAMVVHMLPWVFDGGWSNLVLLAVSIPLSWMSIPISLRATGANPEHAVDVNVVGIIAAALLDGVAITFASDLLYAGISAASQFGGAWILWGVAWILFFAWRVRARA